MYILSSSAVPTVTPTVAPSEGIVEKLNQFKGTSPSVLETYLQDKVFPFMINVAVSFAIAVIVYLIGRKINHWIMKLVERWFNRSNLDDGASGFLSTVVKVALNIVLLTIILGIVGIQTSSLVALVGSAGFTIGLALQGSLSNFSGGVLILLLKPFKVGDYIIAVGKNVEGTVEKIDICYTKLTTIDNQMIVVPNGSLSNMEIINTTNEEKRRIDLFVPVPYSCDINKVKQVLTSVARSCEGVLVEEEIQVFLYSFDASSISMGFRVWCDTQDYWPLKWELQEKIKVAFDKENISIPFNQLDVKVINK